MKHQCSLRLDLLPGDCTLTWQVFDRLTGVNGGIARTITAAHLSDPDRIIESFNNTVIKTCNGTNHESKLMALQVWGGNTCKEIFPDEILRKLLSYDCGDILFMVPLAWADFPFEILYWNNEFLGQRFHIGTIINTGIPQGPEKQYNQDGELMIITDSSEMLQSVCREGDSLKNTAINRKRQVRHVMQADNKKLIAEIPDASIVHFAGHSSPDQEYDTAGWRLGNKQYFDIEHIKNISASPVLPWLVFSNSCNGGRIMLDPGLSGIAGAFLSAGVQQVIGPFCKLNDEQAKRCTISFYSYLFKGKNVAQSLTLLRKKFPRGAGITPLFYRLFGDPRYREQTKKKLWRKVFLISAIIILLISLLIRGVKIDLKVGNFISLKIKFYAPTYAPTITPDTYEKIPMIELQSSDSLNDTIGTSPPE